MSDRAHRAIPSDIAAQAAEWFSLLQDEDASEQDFIDWQQWLVAHPDHPRAYQEMERAWQLIGDASAEPRAATVATEPKRQWFRPSALAAAFAVCVLTALGWYAIDRTSSAPPMLTTGTAEQRSLRLSDGSRVTLGADSALQLKFEATRRHVELVRGEAFFDVAHDRLRPFTVSVGDSEIRAVGTAFNVRAAPDRVVVTVAVGRVQVSRARGRADPAASVSEPILLAAGERALSDALGVRKLVPIDVDEAATWRQGRLEYIGEDLRHIVDDLNRYTDRDIVIADESLGALRYSGTVFPDHVDEWLDSLSGAFPVVVMEVDGHHEIARAPSAPSESQPH